MSYLNSILSSINTGQRGTPSADSPQPAAPASRQATGKAPAINGTAVSQAPKRKAENDAGNATVKTARKEGQLNGIERYAGTARPSATPPVSRPSSTGPDALPYRGTAKSIASSTSTTQSRAKPPAISTTIPSSSRPTSKPSTPVSAAPAPPPKPGSYLAMLARAKAVQQTQPIVGAIKHKQTEKLTKKELLAQKAEAIKQQAASKSKQPNANGRPGRLDSSSAKATDAAKEKKKAPDLGYKGTMRAKAPEPSYTGTMRSGSASKPPRRPGDRDLGAGDARGSGRGRNVGYSSYSDEDEEDYQSDASSDMEAGAFDLDAEENFSLRQARKEDEEALREENELKRQKELRKQSMQRLVEQANAKKKRY